MKVQYCSDLHLKFEDNLNLLSNYPIKRVGDILVIAGDLAPFVNLSKALYKSEIADLCKGFEKVFRLSGSHGYHLYTHHYASSRCEQPLKEVSNLYLVDNYGERIGSTQLILSTIRNHISKKSEKAIRYGMNDFRYITVLNPAKGGEIDSLEIADFNYFNKEAVHFLKKEAKKAAKAKQAGEIERILVVTHYVPTKKHYPEMYLDSPLNEAFVQNLADFVVLNPIDYWIYGHHHFDQPDFKIGNAQLLTNQLSYVMRDEHEGFDWERWVEV